MGKRKMEMKKIENRHALQVTFSKRKKGLFKKAEQLSLLTGASVLVAAFSPAGRPFVFGHEGLMHLYLERERETNIPMDFLLDNIDLEQCGVDELEVLVPNLEEEEAKILELADEWNATKAVSEQQVTFAVGVGFPTLEAAPAPVIDGAEAQLHDDLEIFVMETEEERNTSSEISPASEDFFSDLPPLDISDDYLDSFEVFLMETKEERNTSSEISPASEDFFSDLPPLDVSDHYLDSFLRCCWVF